MKTNAGGQSRESAEPATTSYGVTKVPDTTPAGCMKIEARQDPKALDNFTATIIPCRMLRAAAGLTIGHAALLIVIAAAIIELVRQLLAD